MRVPLFPPAGQTPELPRASRDNAKSIIPGLLPLATLVMTLLALPLGSVAQTGHRATAIVKPELRAKPEVQPLAPGDWIWWDGSSTVGSACVSTYPCGQVGVYGTKGTVAVGNIPGSRSDAMSWMDTSGRKWLFGGFGYDANGALGEQNDLWQSDSLGNAWGWISGSKGAGHSGVYGTVGTPTALTVPGGREGGVTWTDKNGNLWLFGGLGYDGSGTNTYGYENDLWMYNTTTNEWTWVSGSSTVPAPTSTIYGTLIGQSSGVYGTLGTPAAGNTPSGRTNATAWTDTSGNLWLLGGGVVDELGYEDVYNDLWEFNTTTKQWVWVSGGDTLDELGVYGTLGTAASGNAPGARYLASSWTDSSGDFWLFGGSGYASNAGELNLNDLWKFSPGSSQWTYMGGGSVLYPCNILFSTPCPFPGTYGTLGTAASTNFPGARNAATTWTDSSGNLWLFGGSGQDANNFGGWLNDLWEYDPATTYWTWMGGSSTVPSSCTTGNCGQPGVYGSLGSAASASVPGARQTAVAWTDQSGDFWLFGGWGVDENGATGYLNDMWEYQPSGGTVASQAATPAFTLAIGTYAGTQSVSITDSTPNSIIYYTINDTTPTTNSAVYNGQALTVSSTETIEAIATAPGYTQSAAASATYTITGVVKTTPTVTVSPSPSSITTSQSLSVQISVSGSGSTPTGSVTLTSGSYTSSAAPLTSGSATITIPAGSLATSTDTLTATYTPDSNSSAVYNSATGSNTVTVSSTPAASNEWVWMGGSSSIPGANDAQAGVYGTLGTAAAGNIPGGRSATSTWTDSSGNLWVFGGYSVDVSGDGAAMNDLWKFNPSTNQWTWISGSNASPFFGSPAGVYGTMGTAAAGNTPGGRESAATWVDKNGNLWLFGGFGANSYGVQTNPLNDLWEFNPSTSMWTWMGGAGPITYSIPAVYGTIGTAAAGNLPGARQGSTTWVDANGNFWLFGGYAYPGYFNDLWKYNPTTNQWTWINGSNTFENNCFSTQTYSLCGVPGVYGTLGTAAAGNMPGGNEYGSSWTDTNGHVWLFGGYGTDVRGNFGDLNALWEYNPSTNQWTWIGGSTNTGTDNGEVAAYGTLGTFAASSLPGAREGAASWKDGSGNFWLFGGSGFDASGAVGSLNDLWEFSPSKGDWAWMSGSNLVGTNLGQPGVYGTLGTPAAGNIPGGRQYPVSFADKSGNFWLIEGQGFDSSDTSGFLNDVWEYQSPAGATTVLLPAATPTFGLAGGTYAGAQSTTISDTTPNAIIYYTTNGTTPTINSTMYTGAVPLPAGGAAQTIEAFVTAPGYAPSAIATVSYTITIPVETAVATPTFTPIAGTYSSAQTVTISTTTPGASIYYTIDGSTPSTTTGNTATGTVYAYQTGIPISSTGTIKAIATEFNYFNSAVASATFTITPPVASPIGNWAWMGGSSSIPAVESGQPGVYGTLGTASAANIPGGRDDGATWTDKNGNLWLFGGFGYDSVGTTLGVLNDMWEFNPTTNQWTWMGGSKTIPTCSSQCGQGGVYGTLGTSAAGNIPGARDGAATWTDSSGHLWLYGGFGFDANDARGYLNDLWEFNPSTNQWTWVGGSSTLGSNCVGTAPYQTCSQIGVYGTLGTAAAGNVPGAHVGAASWIDSTGNLWFFGGYGDDSTGAVGYLNDVWEFNPSTKQWTWMGGSSVTVGGGQPGVYGTLGTPAAANIPGSRAGASTWTDSSGHFWLFGGSIPAVSPEFQDFNDLWEFNPSTDQWTWMGGSSTIGTNCALQYTAQYSTCGPAGVYGTSGSPAAGNTPGGRSGAPTWIDSSGNFWLFGGTGMDSAGASGLLDDLWSFSPTTKQWTWMGGSNVVGSDCLFGPNDNCGMPGIYGTLGSSAVGNIPGSRDSTSHWTDSTGHFWLFGGVGLDANGSHIGYLNDMWEYQPSSATVTTPVAATPTFSVPGGNYGSAQSVMLSDTTPNSIIYYTTNGMMPNTNSAVYNGTAIPVPSTETIEAIATANGYTQSATATATYTITLAKTTPTVTVSPSPTTITTNQALSVTVAISGTPTPTGSVVLTSGGYSSGAVTLSGGSATITIPAGSLGKGTDTVTATYTPDAASSSTYTNATGSNTETVTAPATAPTVTVTPSPSSITTAQALSVTVTVSGTPTPTGSVVLSGGGYTSTAVTLSGGSATFAIPAGALATAADTLTATYAPDSASSSTYTSATGTGAVTVTTATAAVTPTVTVTPASSSITTAQSLSVTVTVSGSGPCALDQRKLRALTATPQDCTNNSPTGSITLTSGPYTSAATTLASGSATIAIPAGVLANGTDTLTATYTPDSNSTASFTTATGSNTVTVTATITAVAPTVTVTPASSSITTAQSLSVTISLGGTQCAADRRGPIRLIARPEGCGEGITPTGSVTLSGGGYTSAAVTLSGGSATIVIPAGALNTGADTLTATYTPDSNSSSIYTSATGTYSVTVTTAANAVTPTVTVTPASSAITTAQSLSVVISVANSSICTNAVRKPLSLRATPQVGCASGTPTGSVILSGGGYTSAAATLSNGSATITIPAGALNTGADTLTATYTPDSNSSSIFSSATGTNSVTVNAVVAPNTPTVIVTPASPSITTAQSLSVAIGLAGDACPDAATSRKHLGQAAKPETCDDSAPTGTVTLTSGGYTSAATTLTSGSTTIIIPAGALAAGTDTLTATYTPDSNSSSTYTSATGSATVVVTTAVVTAPVASLTPPSLTFTSMTGTTSAAQTATLSNTGNAALTITSIAITGTSATDYAQTNTCGNSLAAGGSCTISVTFTPASAASLGAMLSVTDNAAGSPQTTTLSGTGVAPPSFTVSSVTPTGTASQTTPAKFTITITPQNGSFTSPITFSTSGLPAGYTATFAPPTVTPGSSPATTTLTIQSSPIALMQTLPLATPVLAFLGFCFLPGKRRRRLIAMCLLTVVSLGAVATLSGCGGGFAWVKPSQSYTVTITASGGGQTQTTTVLLTVQE